MVLVFVTPIQDPPKLFFNELPARSVIHGILFLGFTHATIKSLKKQLSIEKLRKNAFMYVLITAILIIIVSESLIMMSGMRSSIGPWNIGFDLLGTFLGMGSFKLLYNSCY